MNDSRTSLSSRNRIDPRLNLSPVLAFIGIVYALSTALSLVIGFTGGHESPLIGFGYLSMFLPALTLLLVQWIFRDYAQIRWRRFPFGFLPLALFLMPVAMHTAMLSLLAIFGGHLPWFDWLKPAADGLYHTPESRGWGTLTMGGLAARIAINAIVGLAVVSVLAFFEEIGWRAWLLPRLAERMGPRLAIVVTSIIWGMWHAPYAFSGIQHIDGISAVRLGLALPWGIACTGLILGWLWLRTESIWIVSLAHGALNNWGQYAFKYMRDPVAVSAGQLLAAGGVALLLIGALLLWRGTVSRHEQK